MERIEITTKVNDIIRTKFAPSEPILPDKLLAEDLGLDSLDNIELIMAIEDEFDVEIDDDAAFKCKTVTNIVDLLILEGVGK